MTGSVLFYFQQSLCHPPRSLTNRPRPLPATASRTSLSLSLCLCLSVSVSQFLYALYIIFLSTRRFRCVAPPPQLLSLAELRWDEMGVFKRNWEKTLRLKESLHCSVLEWLWLYVSDISETVPSETKINNKTCPGKMHDDQRKILPG